MKKNRDTDYLYATTRVRSLERFLLNREQTERMLDAKSDEEAVKVLSECGYDDAQASSPQQIEALLSGERKRVYSLLLSFSPSRAVVDVFRIKYDYHNLKALIKAEALPSDPSRLLIEAGRYEAGMLADAMTKNGLSGFPPVLQQAVAEAKDVLARTSDPQLSDLVLDRACYAEMLEAAKASGSDFLIGYVRLSIDTLNLVTAVRSARIGKSADFLRRAFLDGGYVDPARLMTVFTGTSLEKVFYATPLEAAASYAGEVASPSGEGSLSELEHLCDRVLSAYLEQTKRVPFGEAPLISYMAAKEHEYTVIRTILSGRLSGLPSDYIRQRLA